MDKDEKQYFKTFEKLSLDEIRTLFKNLKHIGMSEEDIEKYSIEYSNFFAKRLDEKKKFGQDKDDNDDTILIGDHENKDL
jgi:hypothetical protein